MLYLNPEQLLVCSTIHNIQLEFVTSSLALGKVYILLVRCRILCRVVKMSSLEERITKILAHAAESLKITNCRLTPSLDALRGDGFLSEFYTGDILDQDTGKLIQVYIKVPPVNDSMFKDTVYVNEYNFFSKIYPELDKFQKEKGVEGLFDKIPVFYCGAIEANKTYIVLENLAVQNYVLLDKAKYIDEIHLEKIFEAYGKYHALTFAYKEQNSEKYWELIGQLQDVFVTNFMTDRMHQSFEKSLKMVYDCIPETDEVKAEKIKPLIENVKDVCKRGFIYDGNYSTLVHGDCWSNNFMFKYDANNKLDDLRLVDFQLLRNTTPIHDLSYLFYSGAGKKDFDKLDEYLDIYHKSFSNFARELGSDPEKLFPIEVLKTEWRKNCFFGILMSMLVWRVKLMSKEKIAEYTSRENHKETPVIAGNAYYNKNICDIFVHAIEYGIL